MDPEREYSIIYSLWNYISYCSNYLHNRGKIVGIMINTIILLVIPFLFIGIINRVKAIWAGKKGTPIFQSFYDFVKLLKKREVISDTTSFLFKIAPSVYLAAIIFAFLLIPLTNQRALIFFPGDFILFSYILG